MRLNIRWRLTLWNTLALAIVLLGFSALVYGLLTHALYERIDHALASQMQELEEKSNPDLAYWIGELKEHQDISCVVYDAEGKVYRRTEELPVAGVPPAPISAPPARRFGDQTLPIIGHQRTLASHLRLDGKDLTVFLMDPMEEVDHELHQLLAVLALAIPLALVLAGGLGYFLAWKAVNPMQHLHRLAQEITADQLDRRLPVANPDDELGHLTQTINAMIGRLERSFAEIRRFTADASHELRTPLTAIRTETEVALRQALSTGDYQHLLGSILEECERLTRLTDQLLTLSREDARAVRRTAEPISLSALVGSVVETMRPLAEAKGLDLHSKTDNEVLIQGDEGRLRQVFFNLLDNAIKYTSRGGRIDVRVERNTHAAVVTIEDTGVGIPAEHLPRVFERFYRVDKARSREEGGTGLGLSIAHAIVASHGGKIELTSAPEKGTTCKVKLPLGLVEQQELVRKVVSNQALFNKPEARDKAPKPEAGTVPCSLREFLGYFLRLGTFGFGGPIVLAGHMQRDLVEARRWISHQDYVEGLAFAQLCPGPLAAQLAMYLGWVRAGRVGATLVASPLSCPRC
jgi:heavy metal sensor kinase